MREGRRCVCSSVAVGLRGGVSIECIREGRRGREREEEHNKSDEKLVIMTIVQTVNEVA